MSVFDDLIAGGKSVLGTALGTASDAVIPALSAARNAATQYAADVIGTNLGVTGVTPDVYSAQNPPPTAGPASTEKKPSYAVPLILGGLALLAFLPSPKKA